MPIVSKPHAVMISNVDLDGDGINSLSCQGTFNGFGTRYGADKLRDLGKQFNANMR